MTVKSDQDFKAFKEFYNEKRSHFPWYGRSSMEQLFERADTPKDFRFTRAPSDGFEWIHVSWKTATATKEYSTNIDAVNYHRMTGDPARLRIRQLIDDGSVAATGQPSLAECLEIILRSEDSRGVYLQLTLEHDKILNIRASTHGGLLAARYNDKS